MRNVKPEKAIDFDVRAADCRPPISLDEILFELAIRDMAADPQIKSECGRSRGDI